MTGFEQDIVFQKYNQVWFYYFLAMKNAPEYFINWLLISLII